MAQTASDWTVEAMRRLEPYHDELIRHATRMLGSGFEAEDAVQETMVRAWNALGRFEGRSQLRSWLYRICTNVCLDMLASRQRQARPGLEPSSGDSVPAASSTVATSSADRDPGEVVDARETVRLALLTMLQRLPPRQRAVLILREVLRWSAAECAVLLGSSVASVNSALQRGRATLRRARVAGETTPMADVDPETHERLVRYLAALESSDVKALTALLVIEAR
jgi:RNA polymerase sigma-70 factor (ECF subfamily)